MRDVLAYFGVSQKVLAKQRDDIPAIWCVTGCVTFFVNKFKAMTHTRCRSRGCTFARARAYKCFQKWGGVCHFLVYKKKKCDTPKITLFLTCCNCLSVLWFSVTHLVTHQKSGVSRPAWGISHE